jgi:hypothetical protein
MQREPFTTVKKKKKKIYIYITVSVNETVHWHQDKLARASGLFFTRHHVGCFLKWDQEHGVIDLDWTPNGGKWRSKVRRLSAKKKTRIRPDLT